MSSLDPTNPQSNVILTIDQAVAYWQQALPAEVAVKDIWDRHFQRRREFLGRFPELSWFRQQMELADAQYVQVASEILQIEQQWLSLAQAGQPAYHSRNVFWWNQLVMQMSGLMRQASEVLTRRAQIADQQMQIMAAVRTMLQQELSALGSTATAMADMAERLRREYSAAGNRPPCNVFLRTFIQRLGYDNLTASGVLEGRVTDEVTSMSGNHRDWTQIIQSRDDNGFASAFERGGQQWQTGHSSLVNPYPTPTDSGHIAVVLPGRDTHLAGPTTISGQPGWNMRVPFVAQGGGTGSSKVKAVLSLPLEQIERYLWNPSPLIIARILTGQVAVLRRDDLKEFVEFSKAEAVAKVESVLSGEVFVVPGDYRECRDTACRYNTMRGQP